MYGTGDAAIGRYVLVLTFLLAPAFGLAVDRLRTIGPPALMAGLVLLAGSAVVNATDWADRHAFVAGATAAEGDADGDGDVDLDDFLILKQNFAVGTDWSQGDFDGDQDVDLDDFVLLKQNFARLDATADHGDFDGDGDVDLDDFVILKQNFGTASADAN